MANKTQTNPTPQENQKVKSSVEGRRSFLKKAGIALPAIGLFSIGCSTQKSLTTPTAEKKSEIIPGFEKEKSTAETHQNWTPVSDRKIKVGLIGYGVCKFAAAFGFQDHPNVEIVAVSDLVPERCAELAKVTNCKKTYPSMEELVKDKSIEAVYIATDAPSHARLSILALKHGKHVAVAVPAVFGSVEEAHELFQAVKNSGLHYMMFETSMFHEDLWAMRVIHEAGGFGKIIYSEGAYNHYTGMNVTPGHNDWRRGLPPIWYPTHATAYYIGVTNGSYTKVSCQGVESIVPHRQKANNRYKNPFGTHIANFTTSEGGGSSILLSFDSYGPGREGGSLRGQKGAYNIGYGGYKGELTELPNTIRPSLPPGMDAGGHGGSHGRLTNEFITSILLQRKPLIDVAMALNMTVPGIIAHQSALQGGKLLDIPQFSL